MTDDDGSPDYPHMGRFAEMGLDGEPVGREVTQLSVADLFTMRARELADIDRALHANSSRLRSGPGKEAFDRWRQFILDFMAIDRIVRGEHAGWPWPESDVPPTVAAALAATRRVVEGQGRAA